MSTKRRCSSLAYGEPLRRFFANWWVSQAARRASRPADGFGGTAAGFGEAEPPCGRRPCFCWNYSRSSIRSGKPAEGVRAKKRRKPGSHSAARYAFGVGQSRTADLPLMERLQVLGIFTSLSGQLGVEAMILFLHQLLVALIDRKKLFVSRQWNILFH